MQEEKVIIKEENGYTTVSLNKKTYFYLILLKAFYKKEKGLEPSEKYKWNDFFIDLITNPEVLERFSNKLIKNGYAYLILELQRFGYAKVEKEGIWIMH